MQPYVRTPYAPLLVALLCPLMFCSPLGCGGRHEGIVPVSGAVLVDGQPVAGGQVNIYPEGKRQCIGPLDDQGRFTMSCYKPGDGVPIGKHRVAVVATKPLTERSNRWFAPKKYANKVSSDLWVEITGPTDDLKIELTWSGSKEKGPFDESF